MINQSVFKAYDIRGIYPTDINEENYALIIRAIYTFFVRSLKKDTLTVVLGRDMRVSSPSLFEVAKHELVKSGATVIDIGLSPTPTFYYAALKYGYDVGIDVTASHNPKEYAGTKFVMRDGDKIIKIGKSTGMEKVKEYVLKQDFVDYKEGGKVIEKTNVLDEEVDSAIKETKIDVSKLKKFKVVADPGNGMGALYISKLFEKVPGDLVKMFYDLDGTFPNHDADPLKAKNLAPLMKRVKDEKADLGIAPDGDGDRVFFINEKGDIISATFITSLIAQEALQVNKGATVIADIRYTRNVSNVVKKHGGKTFISKVGHAFITEDVNREGAYFAGESSGHFYFGSIGGAESAVRVILYVLEAMSREDRPISEILAHLQSSYESGEFNYVLPETVDSKELLQKISQTYGTGQVSWLDGLAVDFPEWRFNIRTSNTEPLMRLNVEADNPELTATKLEEMKNHILAAGAKPKD